MKACSIRPDGAESKSWDFNGTRIVRPFGFVALDGMLISKPCFIKALNGTTLDDAPVHALEEELEKLYGGTYAYQSILTPPA